MPANTEQNTTQQTEQVESDSDNESEGRTLDFTLDAFKYEFSQEDIFVQAGDTVTIILTNSDGFHDFVIDELNVATKQIAEGETDKVTFTIPQDAAGKSYQFYCSVANHRELGMVGKIIVAE